MRRNTCHCTRLSLSAEVGVEHHELRDAQPVVLGRRGQVVLVDVLRHDLQREGRDLARLPDLPRPHPRGERHARQHVDVGRDALGRVELLPVEERVAPGERALAREREPALEEGDQHEGDQELKRRIAHVVRDGVNGRVLDGEAPYGCARHGESVPPRRGSSPCGIRSPTRGGPVKTAKRGRLDVGPRPGHATAHFTHGGYSMKLYYFPGACSLSPHIVLREGGFTFELERMDPKTHTVKATGADYHTVNPKGYVPALVLDDGQLLTEGPARLSSTSRTRSPSSASPRRTAPSSASGSRSSSTSSAPSCTRATAPSSARRRPRSGRPSSGRPSPSATRSSPRGSPAPRTRTSWASASRWRTRTSSR